MAEAENSNVVDMDSHRAYLEAQRVPLSIPVQGFGSGNGGSGMEPTVPMKDYVDSRDDAVEARIAAKLDKLPTKATVWGAVASGVGTLLALLAFAGDRFDGGVALSPSISKMKDEQQERDRQQDAKLVGIDKKLDVLIEQSKVK